MRFSKNVGYERPYIVTGNITHTGTKVTPTDIYEQIEISERWKVEMWSRYRLRNSNKEDITCFYSTESDGTVPMKLWKHSGGIAISRQNIYTHKHIQIKGSSMTKKSKI